MIRAILFNPSFGFSYKKANTMEEIQEFMSNSETFAISFIEEDCEMFHYMMDVLDVENDRIFEINVPAANSISARKYLKEVYPNYEIIEVYKFPLDES